MKKIPKPPAWDSYLVAAPCPHCKQKGMVEVFDMGGPIKSPCPWCGGVGWIPQIGLTKHPSL